MYKLDYENETTWVKSDVCFGDSSICGEFVPDSLAILAFGESEDGEVFIGVRIDNSGILYRLQDPKLRADVEVCSSPWDGTFNEYSRNRSSTVFDYTVVAAGLLLGLLGILHIVRYYRIQKIN